MSEREFVLMLLFMIGTAAAGYGVGLLLIFAWDRLTQR